MGDAKVVYLRRSAKKTHVFEKDGMFWRSICDSNIIFRDVHPGYQKNIDCVRCLRYFQPEKHLHR